MKNNYILSMILVIIVLIIYSCNTTNNLSSDGLIQKRKFRKGYYVQNPFNNHIKQSTETNKDFDIAKKQDEQKRNPEIVSNKETINEEVLMASVNNDPIALTKNNSVINNIKNLYNSDIKDIQTFKKEYNKIKKGFKHKIVLKEKNKSKILSEGSGGGFSISAFVLGVVGLIVAGIICGILAIIFGVIGLGKGKLKGLAIAGLILGIIDLIGALIVISSL